MLSCFKRMAARLRICSQGVILLRWIRAVQEGSHHKAHTGPESGGEPMSKIGINLSPFFSRFHQRGTAPLPYDAAHSVRDQNEGCYTEIMVKIFLHLLLCQEPLCFMGSAEAQRCISTSKQEEKEAKPTAHLFPFLQRELHRPNPDQKAGWCSDQTTLMLGSPM